MVKEFHKLPYKLRLKKLKLTTLGKRKLRVDLIETYKIMTGKEKIDHSCFFILDNNLHITRGHRFKLYNSRSRLELMRNLFSQRVVPYLNKLPETVVNVVTVNIF